MLKTEDLVAVLGQAMDYLRGMQLRGSADITVEVKSDTTLLTIADKESQRFVCEALKKAFPDLSFWGEEGNIRGFIGDGRYGAIVDPLDGTNAFVVGLMTSTIIIGIYDREEYKSIACAIGEPITGKIWAGVSDESTRVYHNGNIADCRVRVCDIKNSTVFVDVAHGFTSHGRAVLTDEGNITLHRGLCALGARMFIPGSNGLMQALVSNGCERVYGSITTAIGFPGDVCGELLVRQAGGYAIGVRMCDDGSWKECDSSDPVEIDALICAGSDEAARVLLNVLKSAREGN